MTIKELEKDLIEKNAKLAGIYKITRKSDGKIYIGQSDCILTRIRQHINNTSRESDTSKIDGAIAAEGIDAFEFEVELTISNATTELLWELEAQFIAKYNSNVVGFNKTKGNRVGQYRQFLRKNVLLAASTKDIRDHFGLNFEKKKILLLNYFDDQFTSVLRYNDCTVVQICGYFDDDKEYGNYIMEELKKYVNVKFDLIVANPPYDKIGANITKAIIDTIDYDEFVNLLPANYYIKNDTNDLYKYVDISTAKPLHKAFDDAKVTTLLAKINKKPCKYLTWDAFEMETYTDSMLKDYFYETRKRVHYAIDAGRRPQFSTITTEDCTNTILLGIRDMNHKHLTYDKQCDTYLWNALKVIDIKKLMSNVGKTGSANKQASHYFITFKSSLEKDNFAEFMYSNDGFRFLSKVFTALNADSMVATGKFLPKVDWTRSWTVEEILTDYGYTQSEIDEVMADLVNFKGMED